MRPPAVALLLLLAVALTAASAAYQRVGARRMVEGEAWCGTPAPCPIRALGAGFPLPYLVDDPQVSVPNAIGLGEDDFRAGAFLTDVLAWFALATLAFVWMRRSKKIRLTRIQRSQRDLLAPFRRRGPFDEAGANSADSVDSV